MDFVQESDWLWLLNDVFFLFFSFWLFSSGFAEADCVGPAFLSFFLGSFPAFLSCAEDLMLAFAV